MRSQKFQFGIGYLMVYITFCCILLVVARVVDSADGVSFAVFGMLFMGVMLYAASVMTKAPGDRVAVCKCESVQVADLIRDKLASQDIHALCRQNSSSLFGGNLNQWMVEVLVVPQDLERAREVLRDGAIHSELL